MNSETDHSLITLQINKSKCEVGSRQNIEVTIANSSSVELTRIIIVCKDIISLGCTDPASITVPRLGSGEHHVHTFRIRPRQVGVFEIPCSVRYIDPEGNSLQAESMLTVNIVEKIAVPPDDKSERGALKPARIQKIPVISERSLASEMTNCAPGTSPDSVSLADAETYYGEDTSSLKQVRSFDPVQLIGETIANYVISEEIGRGGMGLVYKAVHPVIGREVAIKIISPLFSNSRGFVARFKNEAIAMAKLVHENIIRIENMGDQQGMYYLIMEYVVGRSLADILYEKEQVEQHVHWQEAVRYAEQILNALQHAHSQGLLHRDIKPGNIIITEQGQVKVADFGLVKIMGIGEDVPVDEARSRIGTSTAGPIAEGAGALSVQGAPVGTFDYMSPEQHRGQLDLDERTDIYSFGMTFYRMLTGKLARGFAKSPSHYDSSIPEVIDIVCKKCLAEDHEERYRNASEVLVAMKHLTVF